MHVQKLDEIAIGRLPPRSPLVNIPLLKVSSRNPLPNSIVETRDGASLYQTKGLAHIPHSRPRPRRRKGPPRGAQTAWWACGGSTAALFAIIVSTFSFASPCRRPL